MLVEARDDDKVASDGSKFGIFDQTTTSIPINPLGVTD